ncbi:alcohol-forming fatty acyl-CoA reductase [Burkholderiaceae bacterium]|nr:alcohol-forming fatty acyl-CoA reductase [Burkholderiaceae bacterium]
MVMQGTLRVDTALAGKRVLLTGTTGFIAKVVLEKLIREVPGIASIVLLLRGTRAHASAEQRFHAEVLNSSVFDALRRSDPLRLHEAVARMRFVTGEITAPRFGLAEAEFAALASEVDVIVNVAASVNFREELDQALAINTLALLHLTQLARRAGHAPLVQVSTCYVNGHHRGLIAEEIAPPARGRLARHPDGYWQVDSLIAELQARIAELKQRIADPALRRQALVDLGIREAQRRGWNDTYTFTKWLGEQIACREMAGATLSIVRPAIVESAWRAPQPGWIEGMKVGDAIVLAYARGKTTLFPARLDGIADIVPVDLVASSIVLAAAQAVARPGQRRVMQVGTSTRNPIRVGDYIALCQSEMRDNGAAYPRLIRRPLTKPFRTVPRGVFIAYLAVAHGLARAANAAMKWLGATTPLALYERLETTRQLAVVFSFYTSPRCVFDNRRLLEMAAEFDFVDRMRFEVDPLCFDWPSYVRRVHLPGLERFAMKNGGEVDRQPAHTAVARRLEAS